MGCGWCCLQDPCPDSQRRHGYTTRCPDLHWDPSRASYLCLLMDDPELGRATRRGQRQGQGCCAPLNPWRRDVRDRG